MSESELPRAEDPEQYNQRRRLQEISDARRYALNAYRQVNSPERMHPDRAKLHVFAATQSYIVEIENLIKNHGQDKYWTTELGQIRIPPPEEFGVVGLSKTIDYDDLAGKGKPIVYTDGWDEPWTLNVLGLVSEPTNDHESFLDLKGKMRKKWTLHVNMRHQGRQKIVGERTEPVPTKISINALRLANRFVTEYGLDVEPGEQDLDPDPL